MTRHSPEGREMRRALSRRRRIVFRETNLPSLRALEIEARFSNEEKSVAPKRLAISRFAKPPAAEGEQEVTKIS